MWHSLLGDTRLFSVLLQIDCDLAATARAQGCARCGGPLHSANYPRKPRGGPADLSDVDCLRHSFCCAREGCRSRNTPPSVRFLGRRVYLGTAILLGLAFEGRLTFRHIARLRDQLGVDERTLRRWRTWWREGLPAGSFWKLARAGFIPPVEVSRLPLSLLDRFVSADQRTRVADVLGFLSPLSIRAVL